MNVAKKIGKIFGWILLGIIALVLLVLIVIQVRPVKNLISKKAVNTANQILEAELSVSRLDGNFLNGLELEDVFLKHQSDTIGFLPSLKLKYKLFPLFKSKIVISSVEIDEPIIYLTQYADSTWNIQKIVKENPDTTSSEPFSMSIDMEKFEINDGTIFITAMDTVYPRRVDSLFTDINFNMTSADMAVELRKFSFHAKDPNLIVKNIKGKFTKDEEYMRLKDFLIHTGKNKLAMDGEYNTKNVSNSYVDLNTEPLHVDEFQFLIPDLKIPANPHLKIKANVKSNQSVLTVHLDHNNQFIDLKVGSPNLVDFLNQDNVKLKYEILGDFKNIDVQDWVDNPSLKYKLTGKLTGEGEGTEPETMKAKLIGDFKEMNLLDRVINKLDFNLDYAAGNLKGFVDGNGNFGQLHLVPDVRDMLGKSPSYTANITTKNLDLSKLLLNPELKSSINLNGNIVGSGFDPKTMTATAQGVFNGLTVTDYHVDMLDFDIKLNRGDIIGEIEGSGDFGKVFIAPDIKQLLGNNPDYTAKVITTNLNLAPLLNNDSLASDLNLDLEVTGKSFDLKKMVADANLKATPSSIMGVKINDMLTDIHFANQNLDINELLLNTETINLTAKGNYSLISNSDLSLEAVVDNGEEIRSFLQIDSLELSGKLTAELKGRIDSLQAELFMNLDSTRYNNYAFSYLKGNVNGQLAQSDTLINANIKAKNVEAAGFLFNDFSLLAKSNIHSTDLKINADGEQADANIDGNLNIDDGLLVTLEDMMLDYKGSNWKLIDAPATVKVNEDSYEINNLMLASGLEGATDSLQIINADGIVSQVSEQNLDLKLFNINIPNILQVMDVEQDIKGNLDLNLYLRGTPLEPKLEGGFNVNNAGINNYRFDEIAGIVDYTEGQLTLNAAAVPQDSGMLEIDGYVPFSMRMDSMQFNIPKGNDSINLKILADRFPLKIVNAFYEMDEIDGFVVGDIHVDGTINNPNPLGELKIIDGRAKLNQYGLDYREILASVDFKPETVTVDTFFMRSKDGTMLADGVIDFNSNFYKGDVKNSDVKIKFRNFNPVNHRYYNMKLSGDASLHGMKDSVYFDGDVTILKALAYLPALTKVFGGNPPPEAAKPIIIREMERDSLRPDSVIMSFRPELEQREDQEPTFDYFNNVRGKVKVYIPRNTWIRNDQFRMELSGDVEIIKNSEFMEIFGVVDVIRGQYEMLGKTFVIDEGTLNFQGGKELNPVMDVTASYSFRNQSRTEQNLQIHVTGELKEMKISFTVDGEEVNEGDALSYILFGTNMDALGSGEQAMLNSGSAEDLATSTAASILSSELSKFVGKALNVDYVELKAGGSFDNATFVVGKYITNKLFMSYERRFGDFKDENVEEYVVKMEYELFRFLFLQLVSSPINNGIDVIFKFDSNTDFKEDFEF